MAWVHPSSSNQTNQHTPHGHKTNKTTGALVTNSTCALALVATCTEEKERAVYTSDNRYKILEGSCVVVHGAARSEDMSELDRTDGLSEEGRPIHGGTWEDRTQEVSNQSGWNSGKIG